MKKILLLLPLLGCSAQHTLQVRDIGHTISGNRVVSIYGWSTPMTTYKQAAFNICHSRYRVLDGADGKSNSITVECIPGDG